MAVLLVGNPTAQSGRNEKRIARARTLLARAAVRHRFMATAPAGATAALLARALRDDPAVTKVVAMGGDGTFAEVAKGILASGRAEHVALGMLPTGTANDQGKSFGLSSDGRALPRNVAVIAAGAETRLDAGRLSLLDEAGRTVREEHFFDSAGWGISPRVLQKRNADRALVAAIPVLRDLYRDQMVYAGALARTFIASYVEEHAFEAQVTVDGKTLAWSGLTDLVVKATRIYGGMWVLAPDGKHDDGQFEVVPIAGKRDWISKAMVHHDWSPVTEEALGAVGVRHSRGTRGARIGIRFQERRDGVPMAAQIDGEEIPATAGAAIEVLPRALRLIVPRERTGNG